MKRNILLFSTLVLISYSLDKYLYPSKNEEKIHINIMHFIHHIMSNYLFFSPLFFTNYRLHVLIVIIGLIYWYFNNGLCDITLIYNKECGFDEKTRHRDITYHIEKYFNINYYYIFLVTVPYSLYKMSKL